MDNRKKPDVLHMPEVVWNISNNLSKKDLFNLSQSSTFFYKTLQEYKPRRKEIIKQNLKKFNCDKKIVDMQGDTERIILWENLVIIFGKNTINAWDTEKNICLWTHSSNGYTFKKGWVSQNKVICLSCPGFHNPHLQAHLQILDVYTGWLLSSIPSILQHRFITVSEDQIIMRHYDGIIDCLDFSGSLTQKYQSYHTESPDFRKILENVEAYRLLANSTYIIDIRYNKIWIINRENFQAAIVSVPESVTAITINGDILICGLSIGKPESPDIVIIDMRECLQDKECVYTYKTKETTKQADTNQHIPYGYVRSIDATDHLIVMARRCGRILAINLNDGSEKILEQRTHGSLELKLHHPYLFVRSENPLDKNFTIWDITKPENIQKTLNISINDFKLNSFVWHNNTLLLATELLTTDNTSCGRLLSYDFDVCHQNGEVIINESEISTDNDSKKADNKILNSNLFKM